MVARRGGWLALVSLVALCGWTGCSPAGHLKLQVRGSDLSGSFVHLDVMVAGREVEGARVAINGQVIHFQRDRYSGELAAPVGVGETLSLEVSWRGATVTGTGRVPEAPVLIAPDSGAYFSSGEDLVVRWTSATSPDAFVVSAQWSCGTDCGTGTSFEAPGSARTLTIPAGALPAGAVELSVYAYNDGELAGDYEPAETTPGMNIRSMSSPVDLSVGHAPSREVSGTVAGAGADVVLQLACPGTPPRQVTADERGAYAFDHVAPGTSCTVTPSGSGYAFEPPGAVVPAGSADQTEVSFVAQTLLMVRGMAITQGMANVAVEHGNQPVEDALVRLNGQVLTYAPDSRTYRLTWPTPLSTGDTVSLEVTTPRASVTGTAVVPEAPAVFAPAPGQLAPGDVLVGWSSATSPDGFIVSLAWWPDSSTGAGLSFRVPGSARELTVPADQLPSDPLRILVLAVNDGQFTGDYDPPPPDAGLGFGMDVAAGSAEVWVSR